MLYSQPFLLASLAGVFFCGAISSPTPAGLLSTLRVRQDAPTTPQSDACGLIVDNVNDGYAYHYAIDAYACLTSVPFNAAVATRFIKYINETVQFQSTLAYLKDPPTGYQQPAVDIASELSKIQNNVTSQVYQNQYQFEIDVQHLLYKAHDAHLYLSGGINAAFSFLAPYSITAVSKDGKSLPQIYITSHIDKSANNSFNAVPIKTINGEDIVEYLTRLASLNAIGGIEPHADWNQLFSTPTMMTKGTGSLWDSQINFYPGDAIELVMEDGTEYTDYWLALWKEPYRTGPLTTGGDFYNYFVLGLLPDSYDDSGDFYNAAYNLTSTPADSGNADPPANSWKGITNGAYPDPDTAQEGLAVLADGVVSGYLLPDVDAAVLSIPSFGQSGYSIANFSGAVSDFISSAYGNGSTRIVIDLQQNTGGTVELAFSTFRRFFPNIEPFAGSRRRNHELADTLGEIWTAYFEGLQASDPDYEDFLADEWVVTSRLDAATNQNFSSWADYSGPIEANGGSFSLTERFNLSNYEFIGALFEGWIPSGYTTEVPLPYDEPYFDAKNIVILTDGACSSTCALLVEMFNQVGVRIITLGGRPITGPMQAVGGTRGAIRTSADQIDDHISLLESLLLSDTILPTDANLAIVPELTDNDHRDAGVYTGVLSVNLRDQIRLGDPVPLQFKYEPADCRLFYTLANVFNMSRLWRDAVTAAFDDTSLCVEGSTGYSDSSRAPPSEAGVQAASLNFDFGEPDSALFEQAFDLSGGPQDSTSQAFSTYITLCDDSGGCQFRNQRCDVVTLPTCRDLSKVQQDYRCVPYTSSDFACPVGSSWVLKTADALRLNEQADKQKGVASVQPTTGYRSAAPVGACYPVTKGVQKTTLCTTRTKPV